MKTKILLCASILFAINAALGQGTAFTYQGRLNDGGSPAHGTYDFRFKLYIDPDGNNQAGGTLLTNGFSLTNGLFMATLDFGAGYFNGSNYWLEVDVRTNGGSYQNLAPLQPILPTPYAIFANTASNVSGTISSLSLSGTYGSAVMFNNNGNSFGGSFSGNGANITNVNAVALNGLSASNFWKTSGNSGTSAGANFLGTTDNQPLELHVNNQRALRLTPDASTNNSPNVIGGSPLNVVGAGIVGATIGGGGAAIYAGYTGTNLVLGDFNTIAGGWGNTTGSTNFDVSEATIAGGAQNTASGISSFIGGGAFNLADGNNATVAGGLQNRANYHAFVGSGYANLADGVNAVIGGGELNSIETNAFDSAIGGGRQNTIQAGYSFIGGGYQNTNSSGECVIAGGLQNTIQGNNSFYSIIGGGLQNTIQSNFSYYSTIAGGAQNVIQTNDADSTIGGGQGNMILSNATWSTIAGGTFETVGDINGFIGGGWANTIQAGGGGYSVIAGGDHNLIQGNAARSAIGGGQYNQITGSASLPVFGVIAGGQSNSILTNTPFAVIGGGAQNTNNGTYSVIGGGQFNLIQSSGNLAVIPGGYLNIAAGFYSFAAGERTRATNDGAFVWGDGSGQITASTNNNSVTMRAAGGFRLLTSGSEPGPGVYLAPFGTSWTTISDRNAKKNFAPVNAEAVLDKLSAIPVQQWNYKWEPDGATPNLGPMAQDFKAAFYPGRDDKSISTLEFDGVEMAAIQGLNKRLQQKDAEIQQLQQSVAELKQMISQLGKDKISSEQRVQN